jgi:uncharacterized protein YciI
MFPEMREERTFVVVTLDPLGPDQTRLTLRHRGFGDGEKWSEVRDYFAQAWPWVLDRFGERFGSVEKQTGYLVMLRPTREDLMTTGPTPEEDAAIQEHFVRLQELAREGVVLFAGPCTDGVGPGIVLIEAASEAEAQTLMSDDPAVAAGVMSATLHPINFSLLRERDRI